MARRDKTLVAQIERDALDDSVPLSSALRKCLVLGGKSGSEKLRDWATRELQGYHGEDDLPSYRLVAAPLRVDGIVGRVKVSRQAFPPASLPDFAREHIQDEVELRDGTGTIEGFLDLAEIKLSPPRASDLVLYMNHESGIPDQHIESLYWQVSHAAICGVLDQIRTSLTQLVAELRANMTTNEDFPSTEAADQAVQVVVTGKRSKVTVATAQASGSGTASVSKNEPSQEESEFWTRSRRIGAFLVGLATIAGAIAAVLQLT
jgi:hypothetical protein